MVLDEEGESMQRHTDDEGRRAVGYVRAVGNGECCVAEECQRAQIEGLCLREGFRLVGFVRDAGREGDGIFARVGARRVVALAESGEVDAVMVYRNSVLCVSAQEELEITNLFVRCGAEYWSCLEGRLARDAVDEVFLRHVRSGRTAGVHTYEGCGPSRYGWRRVEGRLVADLVERRVILRIWHLSRLGWGLLRTARQLNKEGLRKRNGSLWDKRGIQYIKNSCPPFEARDLLPGEKLSGLPEREDDEE